MTVVLPAVRDQPRFRPCGFHRGNWLAEAQQHFVLNDHSRQDAANHGGLKNVLDVVKAAILEAESFGFGNDADDCQWGVNIYEFVT